MGGLLMAGQHLRGLVGQGMDGRRRVSPEILRVVHFTSGSGQIPIGCAARFQAWLVGAGGGGASSVNAFAGGGGGGGAAYGRGSVLAGQTLVYAVGAGGAGVLPGA